MGTIYIYKTPCVNFIVEFTSKGEFNLELRNLNLPAKPCSKEFIEILLDHIGSGNIGEDEHENLLIWNGLDNFHFTYHGISSLPHIRVHREHKRSVLEDIIGLYKELLNYTSPPYEMGKYDLFKFSDDKFILRISDRSQVMCDDPLLRYLRMDLLESIENNRVYLIYDDGSFMVRSNLLNKVIHVTPEQISTIMTFSTNNLIRNDLIDDFKDQVNKFFRYADV